jgi:hypothetical protein
MRESPTPSLRLFKPFHEIPLKLESDKHSIIWADHLFVTCISPLGSPSTRGKGKLYNIYNNRNVVPKITEWLHTNIVKARNRFHVFFSELYLFNIRKANVYSIQQNLLQYGAHN